MKKASENPQEEIDKQKESHDVFLLGGKDLEMYQTKKRLRRAGKKVIDKELGWSATAKNYESEIKAILKEGKTPVAIELAGAEDIDDVVDIDHHGDKAIKNSASINQVLKRIGRPMSFIDELVAANDAGYIPGLDRKLEEYRDVLEKRYGSDGFKKFKHKMISLIRAKDRQMQGVTPEQEKNAEEAIKNMEVTSSGTVIIRVTHDKWSPVADRLYPTWPEGKQNLIVVCKAEDKIKEVYYFGRGDICKAVKERFNGWGGGIGYGNSNGLGFGGCEISNPDEVISFVTKKYNEKK